MSKFFDGNKLMEITLSTWEGNGYSPRWEDDFFNVGGLPRIELDEYIYIVKDVDYLVEQANDMIDGKGDWNEYEPNDNIALVDLEEEVTEELLREYAEFLKGKKEAKNDIQILHT